MNGNFQDCFQTIPVTQSDTTIHTPPLRGLVIFGTGVLKYKNERGDTITRTFPAVGAGGCYPHWFWGNITVVFDTDTTLTDAEMLGIVAANP